MSILVIFSYFWVIFDVIEAFGDCVDYCRLVPFSHLSIFLSVSLKGVRVSECACTLSLLFEIQVSLIVINLVSFCAITLSFP